MGSGDTARFGSLGDVQASLVGAVDLGHQASFNTWLRYAQTRRQTRAIEAALRHAAATGKAWAVSALIAILSSDASDAVQGTGAININAPCPEDGGTALHRAAQYGHVEVVECLLGAAGIDASPLDELGHTLLYLAL